MTDHVEMVELAIPKKFLDELAAEVVFAYALEQPEVIEVRRVREECKAKRPSALFNSVFTRVNAALLRMGYECDHDFGFYRKVQYFK